MDSVDAAIARLAARQRGVVTARQLVALGLPQRTIARRVANGRLHAVHRGVFLVGHPVPPPLAIETAALLACSPRAVLCHRTAGHLHGLLPAPDPLIHVLVDGRSPRPRAGIRIHRTTSIDKRDIRRVDCLPVTGPIRTLLDLAADTPTKELARAADEIQIRRLATHSSLVAAVEGAKGRRGITKLRAILDAHAGPNLTRSEAEDRFLSLVDRAQLPRPRTNARVGRYEVDAYWPAAHLAVEIDGYAYHSTRAAFERDRRRDAELRARGISVLRVTWRQIVEEPEALVATLAAALAASSR